MIVSVWTALLLILLTTSVSVSAFAQSPIRVVKNVEPNFPAGADDIIYGDVVPVIVSINSLGKVTHAITLGPHVPCSNRDDKTAESISKAILAAARATEYAPYIENGKAAEASFLVDYKLTVGDALKRVDQKNLKRAGPTVYPRYPAYARDAGIEGMVRVSVLVDESGKVLSVAPRSGPAELRSSGLDAACATRFEKLPVKTLSMIEYAWRKY